MTYYIDPGTTKGCAVACFTPRSTFVDRNLRGSQLIGIGTWTERDGLKGHAGCFAQGPAVWEKPQAYPNRGRVSPSTMTAQANDLIALAAAGSACAHVLSWGRGGVRHVLPREWKRQIAKPQHHAHAIGLLTDAERVLVLMAYKDTARLTGRTIGQLCAELDAYIRAGCLWVARNPGKKLAGYSAGITDLLDAVTLGLTEEGRLKL